MLSKTWEVCYGENRAVNQLHPDQDLCLVVTLTVPPLRQDRLKDRVEL